VLAQAVAWVPGRNDVLLTIFILGAAILFLHFIERRLWWMYAGHLGLFCMALLTKETAVILPVLLFFLLRSKRERIIFSVPWATLIALWYFAQGYAVTNVASLPLSAMFSQIWHRLEGILVYFGKAFVPVNLSVIPSMADSSLWYGVIVLTVLGMIVFLARRNIRRFPISWGIAWTLLFLIPSFVSYDHPTRFAFFEHRLYLPLVGMLLVVVGLPWEQWTKRYTRWWYAGITLVASTFIVLNIFHTRSFREQIPFWEQAVRSSPSLPRAHNSLGIAYTATNRYDDAFREYQIAYHLNPQDYLINTSLGVAYIRRREFGLAEKHLTKAIAIRPNHAVAHNDLAFLYAVQNRMPEAEKEWLLALEINPWYALSHKGLAVYYAQIGNTDKFLYHVEQLITLKATIPPELLKLREQILKKP